jgi:hypothetical protein
VLGEEKQLQKELDSVCLTELQLDRVMEQKLELAMGDVLVPQLGLMLVPRLVQQLGLQWAVVLGWMKG